ncbi:MAG: HAD hydrolase-like protein [Bdellovibrionota bacterium]
MIANITIDQAIATYDALLFDAFGVLVNANSALPGAIELINRLNTENYEYYILTNGASLTLELTQKRYLAKGLNIPIERIISSGSLIKNWFAKNELTGANCYVIGPATSHELILEAGGRIVDTSTKQVKVFAICDQSNMKFPEEINHIISLIFQLIDSGQTPRMLVPNPDLIYPASEGKFAITSGSIAEMIERILLTRYPTKTNLKFERLGKPFSPIFEEAFKKTKTLNMALIGDQLITDVAGANKFGIDSILIGTGITKIVDSNKDSFSTELLQNGSPHCIPKYYLKNLL